VNTPPPEQRVALAYHTPSVPAPPPPTPLTQPYTVAIMCRVQSVRSVFLGPFRETSQAETVPSSCRYVCPQCYLRHIGTCAHNVTFVMSVRVPTMLPSSCRYVCPQCYLRHVGTCAHNSAPSRRIFVKLDIREF